MNYFFYILLIISALCNYSCGSDTIPKPKGVLRLEYPEATYSSVKSTDFCPFSFDVNEKSKWSKNEKNCDFNIEYPQMKATIYLTYKKIDGNIKNLLRDAQKFTYDHTIKADNIAATEFVNDTTRVYGTFYQVFGNAASQAQFYATDSVTHFVSGSVYFKAIPNYDSIQPASFYLEKDVKRIMESLRWR